MVPGLHSAPGMQAHRTAVLRTDSITYRAPIALVTDVSVFVGAVDRLRFGQIVRITIGERTLRGRIAYVATSPPGVVVVFHPLDRAKSFGEFHASEEETVETPVNRAG